MARQRTSGHDEEGLLADAVITNRDVFRAKIREAAKILDGTDRGRVALLTGLSRARIDALGGVGG
jgi:hypothetical protein